MEDVEPRSLLATHQRVANISRRVARRRRELTTPARMIDQRNDMRGDESRRIRSGTRKALVDWSFQLTRRKASQRVSL